MDKIIKSGRSIRKCAETRRNEKKAKQRHQKVLKKEAVRINSFSETCSRENRKGKKAKSLNSYEKHFKLMSLVSLILHAVMSP